MVLDNCSLYGGFKSSHCSAQRENDWENNRTVYTFYCCTEQWLDSNPYRMNSYRVFYHCATTWHWEKMTVKTIRPFRDFVLLLNSAWIQTPDIMNNFWVFYHCATTRHKDKMTEKTIEPFIHFIVVLSSGWIQTLIEWTVIECSTTVLPLSTKTKWLRKQ